MTASESRTAKGNARFFAVEAGADALFCGEEIEWTVVDVCDMVEAAEIVLVLSERWENKALPVKDERKARDADAINETTT
jgi:hypothetical protein